MPSDERISVTINTDESYAPRNPAVCSICQQMIDRHGSIPFPMHTFPRSVNGCEGSGWTPDEVDQMVRERRPVPGRYVRPHP